MVEISDLVIIVSEVMLELEKLGVFEELQFTITIHHDKSGIAYFSIPELNEDKVIYMFDLPIGFNLTKERLYMEIIQGYNKVYRNE